MPGWLARFIRRSGLTAGGRALGLALLVGFLALRIADPQIVEELRLRTFDFYQRLSMRPPGPQPAVIVDIDEASLREFGQWPWPRTLIGDLITNIARGGAVAVAFDVIFPEPDRTSPAMIAKQMRGIDPETKAKLENLESNDAAMARSFGKIRAIVAQSGQAAPAPNGSPKPAETPLGLMGPDPTAFIVNFPGLLQNVPELEATAAGRGLFTIRPDPDGIVRRVPVIMKAEGHFRPALAIELLRVATGSNAMLVKSSQNGVDAVVLAGVQIPTDANGRVWVKFNKHDPNRYVSAAAILRGDPAAMKKLQGRLAIIGTSAIGLLDTKTTPVESVMPGVEIHAQLIENIMSNQLLSRPSYAIGAELVAMVVTAGIIILLVPVLGAAWVLAIGAAMAAILVGGAFYLFEKYGLLFDVTMPLLASLTVYLALVFTNYFREEGRRQQIRSAFSQYLSPAFVEELANNPDKLKLGGETKELSILFMDVRDFTSISERYKKDPQGLTRLMNRLLSPLSHEIVATKGTIDKYIGDSIMAFWNAPLDDADHAANACAAALGMAGAVQKLNDVRRAEEGGQGENFLELKIGVGINTGQGVVGNMGSDVRFDYTVLGDSVNRASRVEGQTKAYGVTTIIGSRTNELAGDRFATLLLDRVAVKGKTEPEKIYALLGPAAMRADEGFAGLRKLHEELLAAYGERRWSDALRLLQDNRDRYVQWGLSVLWSIYEERVKQYLETPPPAEWDGVYRLRTK
ncbi:MAG: adenylate/guanylate cyclase domain-containing protein [Rhizobiales bacterium]|nr:adenylate/guanylate cyclase domain-containing protein [Hyphomicrobiales bacterium]